VGDVLTVYKLRRSGGRDLSEDLDIAHPDVPIIGLHRRVKYSFVHSIDHMHKIRFCLAYIPKICLHKNLEMCIFK
jgi:hypothetical protein